MEEGLSGTRNQTEPNHTESLKGKGQNTHNVRTSIAKRVSYSLLSNPWKLSSFSQNPGNNKHVSPDKEFGLIWTGVVRESFRPPRATLAAFLPRPTLQNCYWAMRASEEADGKV
jgi:hypothetical protein